MPDLGSFSIDNGTLKQTVFGLKADMPKLQAASTSNPVMFQTGDAAYCVDTGDTYLYERTTATWYLQ